MGTDYQTDLSVHKFFFVLTFKPMLFQNLSLYILILRESPVSYISINTKDTYEWFPTKVVCYENYVSNILPDKTPTVTRRKGWVKRLKCIPSVCFTGTKVPTFNTYPNRYIWTWMFSNVPITVHIHGLVGSSLCLWLREYTVVGDHTSRSTIQLI